MSKEGEKFQTPDEMTKKQGRKRKKRPRLFSLGRLGSPPPELPNHDWILRSTSFCVNVTLVMGICRKLSRSDGRNSKTRQSCRAGSRLAARPRLLLLPGLTTICGHPAFRCGGGDPSMQSIGKFYADNIPAQHDALRRGDYAGPQRTRVR